MLFRDLASATLASFKDDPSHHGRIAWWIEKLGDVEATKITTAMIDEAVDELAQRPKLVGKRIKLEDGKRVMVYEPADAKLSPASVNRYISSLGSLFRAARTMRLTPRGFASPTRGAERLTPGAGRTVQVEAQDVRDLVAAARVGRCQHLAAMIAVGATTGLRLGNLQTVVWAQVDLKKGTLDVAVTKNGDPHRAALLPWVCDELQRLRQLSGAGEGELIFGASNPKRALASALRMADLPETYTWHHLRHMSASVLAQSGASVPQIMSVLGHKSPSMALRYSHLNDRAQREAMESAWGKR